MYRFFLTTDTIDILSLVVKISACKKSEIRKHTFRDLVYFIRAEILMNYMNQISNVSQVKKNRRIRIRNILLSQL